MFAARRRDGRIRECHGDLHLRNIVAIDDEPVPFESESVAARVARVLDSLG